MSISYDTNINKFEVNMFEYCTLMKDYIVGSKFACVKIHNLMPYCKKDKKISSDTIFINDEECKPKLNKSFELSDYIKVSVFNEALFKHEVIPKGTLMIVMFMDNNINDGYLTNFITITGGASV